MRYVWPEHVPPKPQVYNKHSMDRSIAAVYIGRGSKWGNPYAIGKDGTREQVIRKFRDRILPALDCEELRGKNLVCFCKPLPCHGDLLLEKANA